MRISCIPSPFLSFPWVSDTVSLVLSKPGLASSQLQYVLCSWGPLRAMVNTLLCQLLIYGPGDRKPEERLLRLSLLVSSYFQESFVWEDKPHPISSRHSFWKMNFAECRVLWSHTISYYTTYVMCSLSVPEDSSYTKGLSFSHQPSTCSRTTYQLIFIL